MKETTFIYALCDPHTNEVRYVGKSDNPFLRLLNHCSEANRHTKSHCKAWIRGLLNKGKKPFLQILLEVSKSDWKYWEREMISLFWGNLVNGTFGGDGVDATPEVRQKLRDSHKRLMTPERREQISKSLMGKKQSPETILKRISKTRGLKRSAEFCEAVSRRTLGKKKNNRTPEEKKERRNYMQRIRRQKGKKSQYAIGE